MLKEAAAFLIQPRVQPIVAACSFFNVQILSNPAITLSPDTVSLIWLGLNHQFTNYCSRRSRFSSGVEGKFVSQLAPWNGWITSNSPNVDIRVVHYLFPLHHLKAKVVHLKYLWHPKLAQGSHHPLECGVKDAGGLRRMCGGSTYWYTASLPSSPITILI